MEAILQGRMLMLLIKQWQKKNTGRPSLSEIESKIGALRNLIHLEEKRDSIFAIEILTEDNIKKYAEKNSTKKNISILKNVCEKHRRIMPEKISNKIVFLGKMSQMKTNYDITLNSGGEKYNA